MANTPGQTMTAKTAIVIGAGIAGCSSAFALAQRGIQVTLIERHDAVANEASGNPQAMLYPRLSGDDSASQFALAGYLYSLDLITQLPLASADFQVCGMLQLGFNSRELARLKKLLTWAEAAPHVQWLTQQEASQKAGLSLLHPAVHFPNAAWVNPKALCHHLIAHQNIRLITSTNVTKVLKNNGLYQVYAGDRLLEESPIVILANANQAQELGLVLHLKTQAVRGQLSLVNASPLSARLQSILCSDGYLSPASDGQHCLGASFSTDQSTAIDELDHLANLNKLNSYADSLFDSLKHNIQGGRVSFRCTSADYFPLLGELLDHQAVSAQPPRPNAQPSSLAWSHGLYVNLAHGSRGFSSAPYCSDILARLICGESPPISSAMLSLLNPNRFLLRKLGLKKLARGLPAIATGGTPTTLS